MLNVYAIENHAVLPVKVLKISETGAVRFFFLATKEAILRARSEELKNTVQAAYPKGLLRKSVIRSAEFSHDKRFVLEIAVTFVQL